MQMTWTGAPTIYYGDEAGVCGFTDPDNRRTYPWGHEDMEMIRFHKDMIRIHKENQELSKGSIKFVDKDYNFLGYGRFNREERCLILVNNGNSPITREIYVSDLGIPTEAMLNQLILTDENGYTIQSKQYPVINGKLKITLAKTSAVVLKHRGRVPNSSAVAKRKEGALNPVKKFLHFS